VALVDIMWDNRYPSNMKAVDLKSQLKNYKTGWVAINKDSEIIEAEKTFQAICKKLETYQNKKDFLIIPASKNYFGFIT
jgi:hypothetical protein